MSTEDDFNYRVFKIVVLPKEKGDSEVVVNEDRVRDLATNLKQDTRKVSSITNYWVGGIRPSVLDVEDTSNVYSVLVLKRRHVVEEAVEVRLGLIILYIIICGPKYIYKGMGKIVQVTCKTNTLSL